MSDTTMTVKVKDLKRLCELATQDYLVHHPIEPYCKHCIRRLRTDNHNDDCIVAVAERILAEINVPIEIVEAARQFDHASDFIDAMMGRKDK